MEDYQKLIIVLALLLSFISGAFLGFKSPSTIFLTQNQTTYIDVVESCNQNLLIYINQTPDYNSCQTQDECELKQLKLGLLQQFAFECMNQSWEDRGNTK